MRTWNKRKRPKHWTKPKWETKCISSVTITPYQLIARGIKDKYCFKDFFFEKFKKMHNKPMYKFLASSRKLNNKQSGDVEERKA